MIIVNEQDYTNLNILDKECPFAETLRLVKNTDKILAEMKNTNDNIDSHYGIGFSLTSNTINLEELYLKDIEAGRGNKLNTKIKYGPEIPEYTALLEEDSIYSYKFRVKSSDPESIIMRRYRCECGSTFSNELNMMCPECLTPTDSREYIRGWFKLENDLKVFNPTYLYKLIEALPVSVKGKDNKSGTRSYSRKMVQGVGAFKDRLFYLDKKTHFKYDMYNLTDPEILTEFINKFVSKGAIKTHLIDTMHTAYTSVVPVISKIYRHYKQSKGYGDKPKIEKNIINADYETMSHSIGRLNESPQSPISKKASELASINKKLMNIHREVRMTCFKDKEADLRDKVYGKRTDNSARLIAESTALVSAVKCMLSYAFFGMAMLSEMYQFMKSVGMTPRMELQIRNGAPGAAARVILVKVLEKLKADRLNYVIVKRSPVIYKTSILSLEVDGLVHAAVIRCSPIVIVEFHGDKDGDIFAIFFAPRAIRLATFISLSPRMNTIDTRKMKVHGSYNLVDASYIMAFKMLDDDTTEENIFLEATA